MNETDCPPLVLGGVAIRAENLEEFVEAVEELAETHFGSVSFTELLDHDLDGDTARASSVQYDKE